MKSKKTKLSSKKSSGPGKYSKETRAPKRKHRTSTLCAAPKWVIVTSLILLISALILNLIYFHGHSLKKLKNELENSPISDYKLEKISDLVVKKFAQLSDLKLATTENSGAEDLKFYARKFVGDVMSETNKLGQKISDVTNTQISNLNTLNVTGMVSDATKEVGQLLGNQHLMSKLSKIMHPSEFEKLFPGKILDYGKGQQEAKNQVPDSQKKTGKSGVR